tara:strand:+ start:1843 stop:3993 length:2151 start_codon:yes stop_codon:yes gene_type:complete
MNKKVLYIILLLNNLFSFPDCDFGDPNWEEAYQTVPFDHEFSATISAAQIFIDGQEMITGKLAGFVGDELRALDSDGSSYFPPGDTNVFELSLWSNQASGELFTFKYYSEDNDIVIDLNETYQFNSNDIIGDAFNPMFLSGINPECEDENSNHFGDAADNTGVSELIILSNTISNLEIGDQIGIFDSNGLISSGEECLDILGEILVGYGEWTGEQLEIVAVSHIDFCDFNGPQLPGFIEGNPIILRVWDISEQIEYDAILTISQGSADFQETSFVVISEISSEAIYGCMDNQACNYNENANTDDGSCQYAEENYDCDGNCIVDTDCNGDCGGDAIIDECGDCDGDGANHQCWDGSIVCDPFDCPDSTLPTPDLFSFNQSLSQAFYYINNVYVDDINLDSDDWVAAFKGDVCVGARKWDTGMCTNGVCDIGVMGDDNSDATDGYMLAGDIPSFKIYDFSENTYYNAISSDDFAFENGGLFVIDQVQETDYYCGNNPSCSGCMDTDACNYDLDALIGGDCYYMELNLLYPSNNLIINIDNLQGSIEFLWSEIDESCADNISYNIEIYDQNFQLLFSDNTQQNSAIISYADLNINIGEINSYSWKILTSDILSETFYFAIDAQSLNNMDYGISQFNLYQNYPNPFNPITSIAFDVPYYSFVDINIYDLNGQLLDNLVETYYGPGSYNVYWDAKYYPSGIYLYEMITNEHVLKKKMVLIK